MAKKRIVLELDTRAANRLDSMTIADNASASDIVEHLLMGRMLIEDGVGTVLELSKSKLDDVRSGPVWCMACEGSGRQILSVGGTRCASDHPCQQCAGLGKYLPR